MDAQTTAIIIVTIIVILLIISSTLLGYISGGFLVKTINFYRDKKNTKKFYPLLDRLLEQNAPTKDAIDLYKSVLDISDRNTPDFVSKIIICLEDFKTWKLEEEIKSNSSQSHEWRIKINDMIEEINEKYPFAELKQENKIFFEDFKKFIDNKEFEACKAKLVELSKIFSAQNKEIETMANRTKYAYYITIVGTVIGLCGFFLTLF